MPKVALSQTQKIEKREQEIARWYRGRMAENGISQRMLAKYIGVTPSTISQRLSAGRVTLPMIIGLVTFAKELEPEELKAALTLKDRS